MDRPRERCVIQRRGHFRIADLQAAIRQQLGLNGGLHGPRSVLEGLRLGGSDR